MTAVTGRGRGTEATAERMAEAATTFLAALAPEHRAMATFPLDDEDELRRWYYTPNPRGGLPLSMVDPRSQQRAQRLVATGLSRRGYATASTIMGLENLLDGIEGWQNRFTGPGERSRDPNRYYVAVFGDPGVGAWAWRFGGHHISLHFAIVGGRVVAPTPAFFGANPAEHPLVGPGVLRPLAGEEDLARELLHALDDQQRAVAVLSPAAPDDLMLRNLPRVEEGADLPEAWQMMGQPDSDANHEAIRRRREHLGLTPERIEALRYTDQPKGLAGSRMEPTQREVLGALIRQYVDRLPDDVAENERGLLTADAIDALHFAWAGGGERRQPHYYRLQGPRFLVEYDNTQDGANHIHSVWRDPLGDFGADLLAHHYRHAH